MTNYDPGSLKAEEFISDAEIRETLAYAEKNKNNLPLIEEILKKRNRKRRLRATLARDLRTEKRPFCSHATSPR